MPSDIPAEAAFSDAVRRRLTPGPHDAECPHCIDEHDFEGRLSQALRGLLEDLVAAIGWNEVYKQAKRRHLAHCATKNPRIITATCGECLANAILNDDPDRDWATNPHAPTGDGDGMNWPRIIADALPVDPYH